MAPAANTQRRDDARSGAARRERAGAGSAQPMPSARACRRAGASASGDLRRQSRALPTAAQERAPAPFPSTEVAAPRRRAAQALDAAAPSEPSNAGADAVAREPPLRPSARPPPGAPARAGAGADAAASARSRRRADALAHALAPRRAPRPSDAERRAARSAGARRDAATAGGAADAPRRSHRCSPRSPTTARAGRGRRRAADRLRSRRSGAPGWPTSMPQARWRRSADSRQPIRRRRRDARHDHAAARPRRARRRASIRARRHDRARRHPRRRRRAVAGDARTGRRRAAARGAARACRPERRAGSAAGAGTGARRYHARFAFFHRCPPPPTPRSAARASATSAPVSDRRHGADPGARRAHAQPQEHRPRHPAQPAGRDHRPVGLGQVEPGVRHALRRGPAPLRREPVGLCAAVPAADGQARRRRDRGPVAGDLDRAEGDPPQPALDRRHGHRDPRLPAPAVRARRHAVLPRPRPAAAGADASARWSTRCWRCPTRRG